MQCYNQRMIEILKGRQQQEKHRLPKIQRSEAKTRMAMFKKSLRINSSGSASEDREKVKQVRKKNRMSPTVQRFQLLRNIFFKIKFLRVDKHICVNPSANCPTTSGGGRSKESH